MGKTFVDEFCFRIGARFDGEQLRFIREQLEIHVMGYEVKPVVTDLVTTDYQLPKEYFLYMATKQQDGKLSKKSFEQYKMCLTKMLYDLCLPLNGITVNHLRMHIAKISVNKNTGRALSQTTLDQRKSIIRSFFQWLYEEEYIDKDPSIRIKPVRADVKPREAYQDTQIESLRDACITDRDRAIVDLLTASGIRVAECSSLDREDLDIERREIKVFGKGGKYRTAYLNARTVVSLQRYLEGRHDDNPALFVTLRKPYGRFKASGIRCMLHGLDPDVPVGNIIPHRFRHTMATNAVTNGMPIESVQALLGHSMISTTMRYAHVSRHKVKRDHDLYMR